MHTFYELNGVIYVYHTQAINKSLSFNDNPNPYTMSRDPSVDIDIWEDLDATENNIKK